MQKEGMLFRWKSQVTGGDDTKTRAAMKTCLEKVEFWEERSLGASESMKHSLLGCWSECSWC